MATDLASEATRESAFAEAARTRAATFAQAAEEQEALGALTESTLQALKDANLFGLMTPAELGGLEASPREALEVFAEVSRAEAATGWVLTTCAFANGLAGIYLGDDAVTEVFGKGMPIIAGAGAPMGLARPVDGGFLFGGRWSYGSGIRHATHTHNGGFIADAAGEIRRDLGHHIFVTPISAAVLEENWDVLGLRGTGSVDYAIKECFLPAGYEHPTRGAVQRRGGRGAMFASGMAGMSAIAHTGFFLGIGRRVLDELVTVARGKPGPAGRLTDSETFQEGYGIAEAQYRAARALVFETWREMERSSAAAREIDSKLAAGAQLAMCNMAAAATSAAEFAYKAGGGVALRSGPLQRAFRDALAGRQHARVSPAVLRASTRQLLAEQ